MKSDKKSVRALAEILRYVTTGECPRSWGSVSHDDSCQNFDKEDKGQLEDFVDTLIEIENRNPDFLDRIAKLAEAAETWPPNKDPQEGDRFIVFHEGFMNVATFEREEWRDRYCRVIKNPTYWFPWPEPRLLGEKRESNMKFYTFRQNNSEGVVKDPAHYVVIEAPNAAVANAIAGLYIYFDGVKNGVDCERSGDRWRKVEEWEGRPAPEVSQKPISEQNLDSFGREIETVLVVFSDQTTVKYQLRFYRDSILSKKNQPKITL